MKYTIFLMLFILSPPLAGNDENRLVPKDSEEKRRTMLAGTHVIRRIFHDLNFNPLGSVNALVSNPESKILVILGDLTPMEELESFFPGGLEGFLRNGGAALIASDRLIASRKSRDQLITVSGVTINQEPLVANRPEDCYREIRYCPMVRPVPGAMPNLFINPKNKVRPLSVYSNNPSMLRPRKVFPEQVRPLATLPAGSLLETPAGLVFPENDFPLFGVGGAFSEGRLLVFADHSIFINQMMIPDDTENVEFCYKIIGWLKGEKKQRVDLLFIEDGVIHTQLDTPMKSIMVPLSEVFKQLFDQRNEVLSSAENTLALWEDKDLLNKKVFKYFESNNLPPWRLLRLIALLSTLIFFIILIYLLGVKGRIRKKSEFFSLSSFLTCNHNSRSSILETSNKIISKVDMKGFADLLVKGWFGKNGTRF